MNELMTPMMAEKNRADMLRLIFAHHIATFGGAGDGRNALLKVK